MTDLKETIYEHNLLPDFQRGTKKTELRGVDSIERRLS